MLENLLSILNQNPIISGGRDKDMTACFESPSKVIFDLGANIMTVGECIKKAHINGKLIFIHIDLAEGIGKDRSGLEYLKMLGADGIISTKVGLLRQAKALSMMTVKRVFLLDSQGVDSAMCEINDSSVDMIEIMPGIMHKMIKRFSSFGIPIIAGGLIETKFEVTSALSGGAVAVSTGRKELWYL